MVGSYGIGSEWVKSYVNKMLGIGSDNKRYFNCVLEGISVQDAIETATTWRNAGATDYVMSFSINLPLKIQEYSLHIDRLRIGIYDADANNELSTILLYYWSSLTSQTQYVNDNNGGAGWDSQQEIDYDFTELDCGEFKRVLPQLSIKATNARNFDMNYCQVRYWYE